MKVYKVEVCIIDHDGLGPEEIKAVLENTRYPNHCINPTVIKLDEADIGEWVDNNPLNNRESFQTECKRLFPSELDELKRIL